MKTYFWIEDRREKSGYIFWKIFMEQLYPETVVESKKNSSELVKAVKTLNDNENSYIIMLDNSFDNPQVIMEQRLLRKYTKNKNNVRLVDVVCFEYILLEFKELIQWIYASNDEFLIKRKKSIVAREKFIRAIQKGEWNYKDIHELREYSRNIDNYNVEQLSAKILFDLTRNTGFEVSKSKIGECWIKSCCEWAERMSDDVCGLDVRRLQIKEKMQHIYEGTSLFIQFQNTDLEEVL